MIRFAAFVNASPIVMSLSHGQRLTHTVTDDFGTVLTQAWEWSEPFTLAMSIERDGRTERYVCDRLAANARALPLWQRVS